MKRKAAGRRAGFTLVELLVVVLIIGILGAIMIPGYTKSVESSKADDAAAVVMMIGQANRMYQVDNGNFVANGTLSDNCNSGTCTAAATDVCQLVRCNYLGSRKWDSVAVDPTNGLSYSYQAGASVSCGLPSAGIACARRTGAGNPTYDSWGYVMDAQGIVREYPTGVAPKPVK